MPTPKKTNKYAATAWSTEVFIDLEVPSGQLCQVRRPGVEGLVRMGLLDKMDSITSMIDDKHLKRVKGEKVIDAKSLMSDPGAIVKAMESIDKIVEYVIVQPQVVRPVRVDSDDDGSTTEVQLSEDELVPGVLYTSMIDIQDKMFIYQYAVGGSKDLEKFRKSTEQVIGSMETS